MTSNIDPSTLVKRKSSYRPEIDGLRAVAVLAVLINHLNEHLLPGGYLGVDIFFVISGFVVTASLANRKDANWQEFLKRFYQRRFKRLLPALIINVLVVSIVFSAFASPLDDIRVPSLRTGITSLIGVSNLYLLKQGTDYFALNTQFNPFTHTWSLGVEEQYYLLWPILLLLCGAGIIGTRYTAKKLGLMSIIFLAGSLAYYLFLNDTGQQAASFFLMPARFWELSAGSLAFLVYSRSTTRARLRTDQTSKRDDHTSWMVVLRDITLIALLLSALFTPLNVRVPATVSTVVVTALLLVLIKQESSLGRLLSHPQVLIVGLMSYSLYLWHWPVIVLARWTWGINWLTILPILALIALLTYLSFQIETYFRNRTFANSFLSRPLLIYPLAALFTGTVVVMLQGSWKWLLFLGDRSQRMTESSDMKRILGTKVNTVNCFREPPAPIDPNNTYDTCMAKKADDLPTLFFEGDSHTNSIMPMGDKIYQNGRFNVSFFSRGGCPFPYFKPWTESRHLSTRYQQCDPHYAEQWRKLSPLIKRGDSLVLVSSFNGYLPNESQPSRVEAEAYYAKEIGRLSDSLKQIGASMIIFAPMPTFASRPEIAFPSTTCSQEWYRPSWSIPDQCKPVLINRNSYLKSISRFQLLLDKLSLQHSNVHVFNPSDTICPASMDQCSTHMGNEMLFSDSNHLSNFGAIKIYPAFMEFLQRMNG